MLIMIFAIRKINIIIDSCISNGVSDEEYTDLNTKINTTPHTHTINAKSCIFFEI